MKKIILLFAVAWVFPVAANAQKIEGIHYSLSSTNKSATVSRANCSDPEITGDIIIPEIISYEGVDYVVQYIEHGAFQNNTNLTSVVLPNTIIQIQQAAFYGCTNLASITIPEDLVSIEGHAFYGCTNLKIPIILSDKVTSIGYGAFWGSGITMLSTNCQEMSERVCYECPNLSMLILRNTTGLKIYLMAFCDCVNLKTVVMFGSAKFFTKSFWNVPSLQDVYYMAKSDVYPSFDVQHTGIWSGVEQATLHMLPTYTRNPDGTMSLSSFDAVTSEGFGWQNFGNYVYMEKHNLTYYVNGVEFKSYEHYCWEQITPEAYPQREYGTFNGWSEIPEYMPDNDFNVYGNFTMDEGFNNKIVVNNVDVFCGKTTNLDICLQNDGTDLTAYQFELSLPAGFDIAKNKKGKPDVKLSDRYEDDNPSLSIEELGNGKYRFVCISMTNGVIEGTEGPLMSMNIQVPSDATEGSYTGTVENIVMTHANETKQKLDPVSFAFNVSTYIKGDADGDLEIDVADVVAIVNYILERPSENFNAKAADADEDGEIDVADAVKVVNMILAQVSNSKPRKQLRKVTQAPTGDGLYVEDFSIKEGEKMQISLRLKNAIDYCSFQCDMFLPEGLTIALNKKGKPDVKLDEDRMDDHSLSVEQAANGSYRLVCTSISNAEFYENDGPIVNIMVEPIADFPSGAQEGRIENTVLVEPNGTKHKDSATSTFIVSFGTPTHIDAVNASGTYDIYNLQGVKVRTKGSTTVLPKGLYIINGEKVFVK